MAAEEQNQPGIGARRFERVGHPGVLRRQEQDQEPPDGTRRLRPPRERGGPFRPRASEGVQTLRRGRPFLRDGRVEVLSGRTALPERGGARLAEQGGVRGEQAREGRRVRRRRGLFERAEGGNAVVWTPPVDRTGRGHPEQERMPDPGAGDERFDAPPVFVRPFVELSAAGQAREILQQGPRPGRVGGGRVGGLVERVRPQGAQEGHHPLAVVLAARRQGEVRPDVVPPGGEGRLVVEAVPGAVRGRGRRESRSKGEEKKGGAFHRGGL